jgi:hypothetical protein
MGGQNRRKNKTEGFALNQSVVDGLREGGREPMGDAVDPEGLLSPSPPPAGSGAMGSRIELIEPASCW